MYLKGCLPVTTASERLTDINHRDVREILLGTEISICNSCSHAPCVRCDNISYNR